VESVGEFLSNSREFPYPRWWTKNTVKNGDSDKQHGQLLQKHRK